MIYLFLLLLTACASDASIFSEWKYSQASSASQKGDHAKAQEVMRTMLIDEPNRPDLLYDLGTSSFKNKEYQQAAAYFQSAVDAENCSAQLQEQALFNLGNTCVELKELNDAIVHYERVLSLNGKNEYARHNLEVVKKMLEDQEKQDQQDKQDEDKQDKDDKKDDKQDKKDEEKNKDSNQGGDKQKDTEDSSKGDDGQENENDSSLDDTRDRGDQKENDKSGKSGQDNQPSSAKASKGADADPKNEDKNDGKDVKDKDDKHKDKPENQKDKPENKKDSAGKEKPRPEDQQKNVDADSGAKDGKDKSPKPSATQQAGAPNEKELDLAPEDKWILQVLDRRENDEKKTNKALMRATVDKKLAGQDGKNCW